MKHHLSFALAALLFVATSTATEETQFLVLSVESTGAEFRQAVAHAAPELAEHIVLPSEAPDPTQIHSWRVCDLTFSEAVATVTKLQTKELPTENSPLTVTLLPPDHGNIIVTAAYQVPGGPLVPSSNGFFRSEAMCLAFAAPDRPEGYRVFLIIAKSK